MPDRAAPVLVFGRTGQLGRALARDPSVCALDRAAADLSDPDHCAAQVLHHRPAAVIIAAAYTAVDRAEAEPEQALRLNAAAPGAIATACARLGCPVVAMSSDYVFDGSGQVPRRPEAPLGPLNAYGRSKAAGEAAVAGSGAPYVNLRTSWVISATGQNFVTTMLRLGRSRARLSVVADQIGGPTPADALAEAALHICRHLRAAPETSGTYHFAGAPAVSWAGLARAVFDQAGLPCVVDEIPGAAYPTAARRPLNSRLDCRSTAAVFGLTQPDWQAHLGPILRENAALTQA